MPNTGRGRTPLRSPWYIGKVAGDGRSALLRKDTLNGANNNGALLQDYFFPPLTGAPYIVAVGAQSTGVNDVTPVIPPHLAGDLLYIFCETQDIGGVAAPSGGWAHLTGSPNGLNLTCINVMWLRASAPGTTDPLIVDPGNHINALVVVVRGAIASGDPHDFTPSTDGGGTTGFSVAGGTTVGANRLVMLAMSAAADDAAGQFFGVSNTALMDFRTMINLGTTDGGGGTVAMWAGEKTVAGGTGTTAGSLLVTQNWRSIVFAVKPPALAGYPDDLVTGGAKKTVVNEWIIVGGVKKAVVNKWEIQGGVKKLLV
jgi:hypothetical protein